MGIAPSDRELIERARRINKALSVYVFALQESDRISAENQLNVSNLLISLGQTILVRAARQLGMEKGENIVTENANWLTLLEPEADGVREC